jgi:hypothetical protein
MEGGTGYGTNPGSPKLLSGHLAVHIESVDISGTLMEAIIAGLTDNVQYDKYGTGQTNCQSSDVNGIKSFILVNASDSNPNEISPHDLLVLVNFCFIVANIWLDWYMMLLSF